MTPYLQTDRATLWHARAEEVYPLIAAGSCSMAWVDGPYAMRKAPWDMMTVDDLPAFYAPHYEALDRVLAPSATVYHWGTAAGWARVDPVIRGMGWTFRVLLIWDKINTLAGINPEVAPYADVIEVCGLYERGESTRNKLPDAPWNIWRLSAGQYAKEKWRNDDARKSGIASFTASHPCQKPLLFADRAIRASTRSGDRIIDPFAGTNRIALACHRLPAAEARHAHGIEMDARWLDAIRPSLVADYAHVPKGQSALFGAR